jgi:hypothetical protein
MTTGTLAKIKIGTAAVGATLSGIYTPFGKKKKK